jgi:hypothetical protein
VRANAEAGGVVVETLLSWTTRGSERVDLREVEDEVGRLARALGAPVILDPWQGVLMAQRLRAVGVDVVEYAFTGDGRRRLFGALLDLIRTGGLRSRPHDELRRELLGLEVQETAAGWRVDHRVGRHDDHVVAVALALAGLMGAPAESFDPTPEERAQIHALGWRFPDEGHAAEFDEDLNMWMDDPEYPQR